MSALFIILVDLTVTLFGEKMLISTKFRNFQLDQNNLGRYLNVYLLQATVELTGEHTRGQMVIEKRIGDIYVPKC